MSEAQGVMQRGHRSSFPGGRQPPAWAPADLGPHGPHDAHAPRPRGYRAAFSVRFPPCFPRGRKSSGESAHRDWSLSPP